jgi:hypothetical protein
MKDDKKVTKKTKGQAHVDGQFPSSQFSKDQRKDALKALNTADEKNEKSTDRKAD